MLACLAQDNTFISPSKAKKENRTESELTTEELEEHWSLWWYLSPTEVCWVTANLARLHSTRGWTCC